MAEEKPTQGDRSARLDVGRPATPTVNWDDSSMTTTYANVVNAASTREEVTLFFGTSQTWNPAGKSQFDVRLSDRIVLNPYAAKRLWTLLGAILHEYEKRFGALTLDVGAGADGGAAAAPARGPRAPTAKTDDAADV